MVNFGYITSEQSSYCKEQTVEDIQFNKQRNHSLDFDNIYKGYLGEVVFADFFDFERPFAFPGKKPAWDFKVDGKWYYCNWKDMLPIGSIFDRFSVGVCLNKL
jgi:hypothetical protein